MIDKAYLLYLICMAIFGLLCYKFGHAMGMMKELQAVVDWFMGWDLSEDDPAPEDDR